MTKEKTARVIPNAIQINTKDERFFFTSFGTRDKTYLMLFRVWQNVLNDQVHVQEFIFRKIMGSFCNDINNYLPVTDFSLLS